MLVKLKRFPREFTTRVNANLSGSVGQKNSLFFTHFLREILIGHLEAVTEYALISPNALCFAVGFESRTDQRDAKLSQ